MTEPRAAHDTPKLFATALEALDVDARVTFAELARTKLDRRAGDGRGIDRAHRVALAALFGAKAMASCGAFWFSQRELFAGAVLGFPHALVVVDPLALVDAAADRGDIASLDARLAELVAAVTRAGGEGTSLDRARYEALFDPALVAFASLAVDAASSAGAGPDAARASALDNARLTPVARSSAEALLARVSAGDARAIETWRAITSTTASTGPADEGFWADVAFRFIAPLGAAANHGAPTVVLGVFPPASLVPLVPNQTVPARVLLVDDAAVRGLSQQLRGIVSELDGPPRGDLVDVARERLRELRVVLDRVGAAQGRERLALRRMTAAGAHDDALLAALRRGR